MPTVHNGGPLFLSSAFGSSPGAGTRHSWIASGRTVVSLAFIGPFTITYLRAEDVPRPRTFPIGY